VQKTKREDQENREKAAYSVRSDPGVRGGGAGIEQKIREIEDKMGAVSSSPQSSISLSFKRGLTYKRRKMLSRSSKRVQRASRGERTNSVNNGEKKRMGGEFL